MGTAKISGKPDKYWEVNSDGLRGVAILPVASGYINRDKLLQFGPLGLSADFTIFYISTCGRYGDLMVNALDPESRGPGSSLGRVTMLCSRSEQDWLKY